MGDKVLSNCSKQRIETPRSIFHPKLGKFVDLNQEKARVSNYQTSFTTTTEQSLGNESKISQFPASISNTLWESFVNRKSSNKENCTTSASTSYDWSVMEKSRFYKDVESIEDMKESFFFQAATNKSITSQKLIQYDPEKVRCRFSKQSSLDWENPVIGNTENNITSATTTKVLARSDFDKIYSSFRFNKEMLKHAIVLGQTDNKFIACRFLHRDGDILVLIDQHAAHERIRLEKLLEQIGYYDSNSSKTSLKQSICNLSPPTELMFTSNEIDLLLHYSEEFLNVGIKFSTCKSKFGGNSLMYRVLVTSVPSLFVNVCEAQVTAKGNCVNPNLLKEYLLEQGKLMRSCAAKCSIASPVIFKVLASYACHGAIKFGDKLSREVYVKLVADLSKCKLPFQCAHGRPAIAPLFQLSTLTPFLNQRSSSKARKPNLKRMALEMKLKSKYLI